MCSVQISRVPLATFVSSVDDIPIRRLALCWQSTLVPLVTIVSSVDDLPLLRLTNAGIPCFYCRTACAQDTLSKDALLAYDTFASLEVGTYDAANGL